MTKLTIDQALREKLLNLTQSLELCDESGRVLARLIPTLDPSGYEPLQAEISNEELERRSKSNERRFSTAEVLAHLEKL